MTLVELKQIKYPNYKDLHVEWLGEIPKEWECVSQDKWICESDCVEIDVCEFNLDNPHL